MYIEEFNDLLREKSGYAPKRSGKGYSAHCPAHDDSNPSLSIAEGDDGRILLHCHAKCPTEEICAALKIEVKDLFPEKSHTNEETPAISTHYIYEDEYNNPLYRKTRIEPGKNGRQKDFFLSTFDSETRTWTTGLQADRRVLYKLPKVLEAAQASEIIFLVEGEKNAEDLLQYGLTATTSIEGAGAKWKEEYTQQLKNGRIALLYDEDQAGHKRRDEIIHALSGQVASFSVIKLPGLEFTTDHGQDVSDWLKQGNTTNDLIALVHEEESKHQPIKIKAVNIDEFLSMSLPERQMILKPFLPTQGLCLLYAKRGVGKTHVALNIAYAVASGSTFLRWEATSPRKVLYIDGEMPGKAMQERLRMISLQADKHPSSPDYLRLITPDLQPLPLPDLSTLEGQKAVDELCEGVELIIIDNLSTLVRRGNENEAESWLPIQTWALQKRREGKSILFIHHANKSGAQRGTSRREDILDAVINLKQPQNHSPDEGARFEVVFEKNRHFTGQAAESFEVFLRTEEDGLWHWDIIENDDELTPQIQALHQQKKSIREIAKTLNITKHKVETRLQKIKESVRPSESIDVQTQDNQGEKDDQYEAACSKPTECPEIDRTSDN